MTTITLPWPPKQLSPNARIHWSTRARHAKAYKAACYAIARQAGLTTPYPAGKIALRLDFYAPARRRRDLDNLLASMKAGIDGVAWALGVDDSRFTFAIALADEIGGYVRMTIEDENENQTAI